MSVVMAGSNRLRTGAWTGVWSDLPTLELPPLAAVAADDHLQAVLALASHLHSGGELLIASATRFDADVLAELREAGFAIVHGLGTPDQTVDPPTADHEALPGTVWLLTSGSTGRPKRVRHSLQSLTTVRGEQPPRTWLCAYAPGAYAWWQVITLGLVHDGNHVVCVEAHEIQDWPALATSQEVTAISGTPTFWRHAIWRDSEAVAVIPLEQVTLGGEPVDQSILDLLHELHPQARISWIYASSEAGAAIAVHDGRAGFPEQWLDQAVDGRPRVSVVGGELTLSSPFASAGNGEDLRTGDRVEIADGRVRIVGRIGSDEINVGGSKVSASEVRDLLLSHPYVAWASVVGRRAPIVGHVVVAQVVLTGPVGEVEIKQYCAQMLPDYAVPRRITVLSEVPLKESMKSDV